MFFRPKLFTLAVGPTTWTAGWETIPFGVKFLEAKCVLPGEACTAPAQGNTFLDPRGKAQKGVVTDLYSDTSYDCFVIVNGRFGPPKCSERVRITTEPLPPFVYSSSQAIPDGRRRVLQDPSYVTERCVVGMFGNFTDCIDSGLDSNLIIVLGVVDPRKRWISFADETCHTCSIGPLGTINSSSCQIGYAPPENYALGLGIYDPLGTRVWLAIYALQTTRSSPLISKGNVFGTRHFSQRRGKLSSNAVATERTANDPKDYYVTCSIDAQGMYTGCTQSAPVTYAFLVGPSPDSSGYYANNMLFDYTLQFCQNEPLFSCTNVTGIPQDMEISSLSFLTDTVVYLSGENASSSNRITARCDLVSATEFTDCNLVYESADSSIDLLQVANDGANAYILRFDYVASSYNVSINVCDVNQANGSFEKCTGVLSYDPGQYSTNPIFSSPIIF